MSKLYPSKVNWKDEPSTETPLNAYNLNKMEQGIVNVAEAVDGNLEDVDTLKADMDLANKRIDEISKLPQGSTTGDAELADIRVGYNGKTYDNAGNSVRGQIKDLHDSLQLSNAVGNSLSLNTSIGGIRINEIEGVTHKSKNLIDVVPFSTEGGNTLLKKPNIELGKQYVWSGKFADGASLTSESCTMIMELTDGSVEYASPNATFSISKQLKSFIFYYNGNKGRTTISNFMLNEGDTALPYEPYGMTSAGSMGLVDLGDLEWSYDIGTARFEGTIGEPKGSKMGDNVKIVCDKYSYNPSPVVLDHIDNTLYIYDWSGTPRILLNNSKFTDATAFKNAMKGVLLAYELTDGASADKYALGISEHNEDNSIKKSIIIPLSKPLCSVGDIHDTILKKDGKWGVMRRFGYDVLDRLNWSLNPDNNMWSSTDLVSVIKTPTTNADVIKFSSEMYDYYSLYSLPKADGSKNIAVNRYGNLYVENNDSSNNPTGKIVYELATPFFEEITDQSTLYQLESYADNTYLDTAEGLAVLDVEYGQSAIVAEMLRTQNMESIRILNDKSVFSSRRFILIGDSYGEGYNSGLGYGWCDMFKNIYGLSDYDCKCLFEGGAGFSHTGISGHTFLSLLQSKASEIKDKDTITDVVVLGGFNDNDRTAQDIGIAILNGGFVDYVKDTYKNATIHLGFVGWMNTRLDVHIDSLKKVYDVYSECANKSNKIHWLKNMEYIMHKPDNMSSDNFHPNAKGIDELARGLYKALYDDLSVNGSKYEMDITTTDGISLAGGNIVTSINNNNSTIDGFIAFNFGNQHMKFDSDYHLLGAFKNSTIIGKQVEDLFCDIPVRFAASMSDGAYISGTGSIALNSGLIFFSTPSIRNNKGLDWDEGNVTSITFRIHTTTVDSMIQ